MLGYQPLRCMKHNLIADVVKLSKFSSKQCAFFYIRIVKGTKSNAFTCKLCARVLFIILLTGLLCDNSNSLTYKPQMGQSPTLSRANCVIYIN